MNRGDEKKFDLKIDFREQRSGIVGEIEKLTDQLSIEMSMLSAGVQMINIRLQIIVKINAYFTKNEKDETGRFHPFTKTNQTN